MNKPIILFLLLFPLTVLGQVTNLSCSGEITQSNRNKMDFQGNLKIDYDKKELYGEIYSFGNMSGIPVFKSRISRVTENEIIGTESFSKNNQNFSLVTTLNRTNGQVVIFEFPDGVSSYSGYSLIGFCKVQKQLF